MTEEGTPGHLATLIGNPEEASFLSLPGSTPHFVWQGYLNRRRAVSRSQRILDSQRAAAALGRVVVHGAGWK